MYKNCGGVVMRKMIYVMLTFLEQSTDKLGKVYKRNNCIDMDVYKSNLILRARQKSDDLFLESPENRGKQKMKKC